MGGAMQLYQTMQSTTQYASNESELKSRADELKEIKGRFVSLQKMHQLSLRNDIFCDAVNFSSRNEIQELLKKLTNDMRTFQENLNSSSYAGIMWATAFWHTICLEKQLNSLAEEVEICIMRGARHPKHYAWCQASLIDFARQLCRTPETEPPKEGEQINGVQRLTAR